ncbi:MAG: aldose epimerase family protein [Pseudomonadota bacterium]
MAEIDFFGHTHDGRDVHVVRLAQGGMRVEFLTYGARIHGLSIGASPNMAGHAIDLSSYEGTALYTGAIVAPVINRIAGGAADIGGRRYQFELNEHGRNTLHSGHTGTQARVWQIAEYGRDWVTFAVMLQDGEGGFPGVRVIRVTYRLLTDCMLQVRIEARTDAPTLMNPALHSQWNLDGSDLWTGHRLSVAARRYLPITAEKIPTGQVAEVTGTPFDLRGLKAPDPGLDHNYCFPANATTPVPVADLVGRSGRRLRVYSDAPGLQVYCGGLSSIALEPQMWPDAPHHEDFPSILLMPDQIFRQESHYLFDI